MRRTACELATFAQGEIAYFFRKSDATARLNELAKRVTSEAADDHIATDELEEKVHTILELAIQRVAEKMAWDLHRKRDATLESVGIPALLDLCTDGATRGYLMLNAPYKILEDLMDCQTIVVCEQLWGLLESRRSRLTTTDFIQAGKNSKASLCLLRMCNALLRRLSKTHNTVFCGRILMFLAYTFSLSERSGVNLLGRFNTSNVTKYQTEAEFQASMEQAPLEEATKTSYALYKVFWDMQRFLSNPTIVADSDAEWTTLFQQLDDVLSAFESNPFSDDDIDRARELQSQSEDDQKDHFFQTKYLTNSRLFHLQLRDPVLRECMLTQLLILFGHLERSKVPAAASKTSLEDCFDRVFRLLEKNVNGQQYSAMLTEVLERERNYVAWKLEKCPKFERRPDPADATDGDVPPPKRPKVSRAPTIAEGIFKEDDLLQSILGANRATVKPLKEFTDQFEMAWDPENGIERAYWPDNDKMICWKTMRSCMRTQIVHLNKAVDGVSAIVKSVLGKPAETPVEIEASPLPSPVADDETTKLDDETTKLDDAMGEDAAVDAA
ncbi:hypothetical protein SDRG_01967 [Saprolegnia diclina VS20]|uniref:THO complex subunit 1 n=1 Tax=Saprolegnia diclina (strain VS20) TaxID=1156394 RepID=T0SDA1_SAPDV|nr:hypothetical protein SDRG_01967 [Saprolegnia diclina VS20]EQC40902.1 hypothetical protein SDRG_01967 [Saprolegnia diclina VS20]|eukprot:XP_008605746.1 hypothetical protein SDRG_01967 [Saprolegnia diclina VS20]